MIELTREQRAELSKEVPTFIDPETQQTYVLIRKDEFDRMRSLLEDDLEVSRRELSLLVERNMREYDEGDPSLELYQEDSHGAAR